MKHKKFISIYGKIMNNSYEIHIEVHICFFLFFLIILYNYIIIHKIIKYRGGGYKIEGREYLYELMNFCGITTMNILKKQKEERPMLYQQGDVLIRKINGVPKEAKKVKAENGRLILVRGEATGHHHSVMMDGAELYECSDGLVLHCDIEVQVEHQEHNPIAIPAGDYQIIPVREYDHFQEESRRVVD